MSDELLSDAMDVVLVWGPERSVPELDRLRALQDLPNAELHAALAEAYRVLGEAEGLAPGIKDGTIQDASARLSKGRPQLAGAIQQGLYSHWRDTGI